jgi:hypothetical protein
LYLSTDLFFRINFKKFRVKNLILDHDLAALDTLS